jgi:TonB-linked SusC/RagA family outer membrane protein
MRRILLITLMLFAFLSNIIAQDRVVTGTVTDGSDGSTLPGVNVKVKGTTIGTITDFDGMYKLNVPSGSTTLVFSYVGMKTLEFPISGNTVNAVMETDTKGIDEVVVVGYGTQKKSDMTGSVTSVKASELVKAPVLGIDQALQGRASGVVVQANNGSPGADIMVRIRGIGSTTNSDPMYIVDGMPVTDIKFLNPNDIESMEVLKDAAASAIYGARAANGVILISSKKGKIGKPVVTFEMYYGNQSVWKKPEVLNTSEWLQVSRTAHENAPKSLPKEYTTPIFDSTKTTDWFNEITRTAPIQNYNLSISGGDEKTTYAISSNYFKQDGIVKRSNYTRTTFKINTDHKVTNRLKIGQSLAIANSDRLKIDDESNVFDNAVLTTLMLDPITPVKIDVNDPYQKRYLDANPSLLTLNDDPNYLYVASPYTDVANPAGKISRTNLNYKNLRLLGTIYAELEIIENLKFKSSFGLDLTRNDIYNFVPKFFAASDENNLEPKVYRGFEKENNWLSENTLTYNKTFAEKHNFVFLLGYTVQADRYEWADVNKKNTPNNLPDLQYLSAASSYDVTLGSASEWAMLGYLGRLNYSYESKYLMSASIRRDGSSKFGTDYRYGNFPSFSLGWNVSNEKFMQGVPYLTNLKLRGSWGQIGNDRIPLYQYQTTISLIAENNYTFVDPTTNKEARYSGASITTPANKDIKWETVESSNFALDFGAFDNKLTGTLEYYVKKTKDMLVREPVPSYTGYSSSPYTNVGDVENKGLELSLNYRKSVGEFTYDLGFNITTVKNEVLNLGKGTITSGGFRDGSICLTQVGGEIGAFYGRVTDGIFQNQDEINNYMGKDASGADVVIQPKAKPGYFRYKDIGSYDAVLKKQVMIPDGKIDDYDRTIIGSPVPDYTYGINLSCAYKGLDLSLFFQGSKGNEIFNATKYYTMNSSTAATNKSKDILNSWHGEGTSNSIPIIDLNGKENYKYSTFYIEDGSYLRLKNIQLGYSLPQSILKLLKIGNLRAYVGGQNLLTITGYSGLDPEIGGTALVNGIDFGQYPQSRTITFGVSVTY